MSEALQNAHQSEKRDKNVKAPSNTYLYKCMTVYINFDYHHYLVLTEYCTDLWFSDDDSPTSQNKVPISCPATFVSFRQSDPPHIRVSLLIHRFLVKVVIEKDLISFLLLILNKPTSYGEM